MSMSWRDSTAPMPLFPSQHTDELPFVAKWVASQPRPRPRYRMPLGQWLAKLCGWLIVIALFYALAVGPALALGK